MDWILWIDCDETMENVDNLFKYLKPNAWDGYAISQHHYAVEPAALFKTDLPCRLFRNHRGIKFYGHVHEHPEKEINSGAGHVWLLPDVAIMHTGYSTERVRRERFNRNYPLMAYDRKKWPGRNLGKFLWMRDMSHQVRYLLERTGGQITQEIAQLAAEVVNLWRELLKLDQARMVVEGLAFYTEAVKVLTRGRGVQFALNLRADIAGNGTNPAEWYNQTGGFRKEPYIGTFMNTRDIKDVSNLLLKHNLAIFEEKYF
jgi:hypothetical protein